MKHDSWLITLSQQSWTWVMSEGLWLMFHEPWVPWCPTSRWAMTHKLHGSRKKSWNSKTFPIECMELHRLHGIAIIQNQFSDWKWKRYNLIFSLCLSKVPDASRNPTSPSSISLCQCPTQRQHGANMDPRNFYNRAKMGPRGPKNGATMKSGTYPKKEASGVLSKSMGNERMESQHFQWSLLFEP